MLEVELDPNYRLYVLQLIKDFYFLCIMKLDLRVKGVLKNTGLQLGINECRVYHNALLESNSKS
jgi:hypothetical protein